MKIKSNLAHPELRQYFEKGAIKILVLFCILALSWSNVDAQITINNYPYINWTGITPFGTAPLGELWETGRMGDGVDSLTIGEPVLLGIVSCSDTTYSVTSYLDVTNNPNISWDGAAQSSSSMADIDGKIGVIYDTDFLDGEDNKITAYFSFEQIVASVISPISQGMSFKITGLAATNPGEVVNIRIYNGTDLLSEDVITYSNNCSPIDRNNSGPSSSHIVTIPVGLEFTNIEIDFWECLPSTTAHRVSIEEFMITQATCNILPPDYNCGEGSHYQSMRGVGKGNKITILTDDAIRFQDGYAGVVTAERLTTEIGDKFVGQATGVKFGVQTELRANTNFDGSGRWPGYSASRGADYNLIAFGGDSIQIKWQFRSPLTNPVMSFHNINYRDSYIFTDCDDNPIPLENMRYLGGKDLTFYKGKLLPAIIQDNQGRGTGSIEFIGDYSCIKFIKISLPIWPRPLDANRRFTYLTDDDKSDIMMWHHCAELYDEAECDMDMYLWKVDSIRCEYLIRDKNGLFYRHTQPDFRFNINHNQYDQMFKDAPVDGTVELVEKDVVQDCPDIFECPLVAAESNSAFMIQQKEPAGSGYLLDRHWRDENTNNTDTLAIGRQDISSSNGNGFPGAQWNDSVGPFSGPVGDFGLPDHGSNGVASGITPLDPDQQIGTVGFRTGFASPFGNKIANLQQDGWLAIPPGVDCVEFDLKSGQARHSTGFFVIESDGKVVHANAAVDSLGVNANTWFRYCVNNPHTTFGCGWQLIRIRVYQHLFSGGIIDGEILMRYGRTTNTSGVPASVLFKHSYFEPIKSNFLWPADSHGSLVVPANLDETVLSTVYGIKDRKGVIWETNGTNEPIRKYDFPYDLRDCQEATEISSCDGLPSSTRGSSCEEALAFDFCAPIETCEDAITENIDICELLAADPTSPLGTLDCDGGGQNNAEECSMGLNPISPVDDVVVCDPASPAPVIGN